MDLQAQNLDIFAGGHSGVLPVNDSRLPALSPAV